MVLSWSRKFVLWVRRDEKPITSKIDQPGGAPAWGVLAIMLLAIASGVLGVAQRKRLRVKRLLVRAWMLGKCGAVIALCAMLGWGVYTVVSIVKASEHFQVRTIDIRGHTALSRRDVLYLLAIPSGATLFQLDFTRMGGRLERHPQVQAVSLRRQFPGILRVVIQERVPRLVVTSGPQHVVVGAEGVVLRSVISEQDHTLPRLILNDEAALAPGMHLRQREVSRALELMRDYRRSAVADTLRVVSLTVQGSGTSSWTVEPDNFTIRVGEGSVTAQLQRLSPVLRYIRQHHLAVRLVDVSYRNRVVVVPES
jgi:cell division septal protein FtsQ